MEVSLGGAKISTSGKAYMGRVKLGSLSTGSTMTPDRLMAISSPVPVNSSGKYVLKTAVHNT